MIIGQSVEKIDALAKVTGAAKYSGDLSMPGMLYAKTLFAERPHARILNIDLIRSKFDPRGCGDFHSQRCSRQ